MYSVYVQNFNKSLFNKDLLRLSSMYCESRLTLHVQTLIKQSITVNNCARLYASAINYNAKVNSNKNFQTVEFYYCKVE